MLREKPGSELAIKFLHYKISTSWRCEESGGGQKGTVSRQGLESKAWADGTELIKAAVTIFTPVWERLEGLYHHCMNT